MGNGKIREDGSGMGVGVIVMSAVCVVMLGAAVLVMKRGLGRYESCGN